MSHARYHHVRMCAEAVAHGSEQCTLHHGRGEFLRFLMHATITLDCALGPWLMEVNSASSIMAKVCVSVSVN
jgi:hypothetical protein